MHSIFFLKEKKKKRKKKSEIAYWFIQEEQYRYRWKWSRKIHIYFKIFRFISGSLAPQHRSIFLMRKKYCIPHLFKTRSNADLEVTENISSLDKVIVILRDYSGYVIKCHESWIMVGTNCFDKNVVNFASVGKRFWDGKFNFILRRKKGIKNCCSVNTKRIIDNICTNILWIEVWLTKKFI